MNKQVTIVLVALLHKWAPQKYFPMGDNLNFRFVNKEIKRKQYFDRVDSQIHLDWVCMNNCLQIF